LFLKYYNSNLPNLYFLNKIKINHFFDMHDHNYFVQKPKNSNYRSDQIIMIPWISYYKIKLSSLKTFILIIIQGKLIIDKILQFY